MPQYGNFIPRRWQQDHADKIVALAKSGSDRTLLYACPGAGKTLAGLYIFRELVRRAGCSSKLLVFTPNLAIKSQWIDRAAMLGFELEPLRDSRRLLNDELDLKERGFVLSYQQAINNPVLLEGFCERHKPVVILDEVHHTEGPRGDREGNRWGATVERALAPAGFKLCTTGTPFREGNNPISFVTYNENHEVTSPIQYSYSDAIRDGVCRPIEFESYDGVIQWIDRGHLISADFSTALTKRQRKQRLRAAVSLDGEFPVPMLEAAHERLMEIRKGQGVDAIAGGLVVAESTNHADVIANHLAKLTGQRPTVVHNKIDDNLGEIERFREGSDPWIVGVSMISEGVDIPRLRVGIYTTNISSSLYFHQFCGRLMRTMESRHERSFVFMPDDAELVAIAQKIAETTYHTLGEEPRALIRRGIGGTHSRPDLEVEDSNSAAVAKIWEGERILMEEIKHHRRRIDEYRSYSPSLTSMSDAEVLMILKRSGVIKGQEVA